MRRDLNFDIDALTGPNRPVARELTALGPENVNIDISLNDFVPCTDWCK